MCGYPAWWGDTHIFSTNISKSLIVNVCMQFSPCIYYLDPWQRSLCYNTRRWMGEMKVSLTWDSNLHWIHGTNREWHLGSCRKIYDVLYPLSIGKDHDTSHSPEVLWMKNDKELSSSVKLFACLLWLDLGNILHKEKCFWKKYICFSGFNI